MQYSRSDGPVVTLKQSQRHILEEARAGRSQGKPLTEESPEVLEMWRSGLLRRNGAPGFQISGLGLQALDPAARIDGRPAGGKLVPDTPDWVV